MAILTCHGTNYTVDHAVKGADYIHGYDANGVCVVSLDGVTSFSGITYTGAYMSPEDCATENCNNLRCYDGRVKTLDGRDVPPQAIGAAPTGYGLGVLGAVYTSDINTCTSNGWYYTGESTLNVPNNYFKEASVLVTGRTSKYIAQKLTSIAYKYVMMRYTSDGGATWVEEWENPPVAAGVEYRTTERWNGKPVFTQLIDCGLSADKKTISYLNSEQIMAVIRHAGRVSGSVAPQANSNDWTNAWSVQFLVSTTSALLRCGTSLVEKQAYLQIWYIKGAEFE